jgi:hypothetical protein
VLENARLVSVDVSGRTLLFPEGVLQDDVRSTTQAYVMTFRRILAARRWRLVAAAMAAWIIPMAMIYALGFATRWVWRGFLQQST